MLSEIGAESRDSSKADLRVYFIIYHSGSILTRATRGVPLCTLNLKPEMPKYRLDPEKFHSECFSESYRTSSRRGSPHRGGQDRSHSGNIQSSLTVPEGMSQILGSLENELRSGEASWATSVAEATRGLVDNYESLRNLQPDRAIDELLRQTDWLREMQRAEFSPSNSLLPP